MASFCPSTKWSWAGATARGRPRWLSQAVTQARPGLWSQPPLPLPSPGEGRQSCPAGPADGRPVLGPAQPVGVPQGFLGGTAPPSACPGTCRGAAQGHWAGA